MFWFPPFSFIFIYIICFTGILVGQYKLSEVRRLLACSTQAGESEIFLKTINSLYMLLRILKL